MTDTPSVPPSGDDEPTSSYPRYDNTNPYGLGPIPAWSPGAAATEQPPVPERPRRRSAFAATVVAASLLVGGAAGVGGAAAFNAWSDDDNAGTAAPAAATTSPVVTSSSSGSNASSGSVQDVAAAVLPSVVKIDVVGSQEAGSGSGIILSSDGKILTNNHVVEVAGDGGSITVDFNDGSHAKATVLGTDPLTDTAVIQAQDVSGLTAATIGKSTDLQVGQGVVAIGSPFGLDATVTSGIVSALDRPVDVGNDGNGNSTVYPAVQTDAAINPGNSGGPLVDLDGHVVGINASIQTTNSSSPFGSSSESGSIGLGFAIPIDEVMPVVQQMIDGETPTHARLGISVSDVGATRTSQGGSTATVSSDGAEIQSVGDGSTASDAGLEKGDVITKVDDHLITSADSLVATIRSYRPGDDVTVTYTRDGKDGTVKLTLDSDQETSNS